ncbi:single-stranded DNA-binding protein [Butyricicoccus sp. 1XD8-22]|nr:single-stranded DNA-binding protein [Butyricicoccus sp. 1XD8-22]
MNKVTQIGRITKDLDLKQGTNGGKSFVRFQIGVKRKYKNEKNEYESDFFVVKAWGKLAERLVQYQGKGSLIAVDGRLESGSYTDPQSGKTIYTTDIIAEDIEFLEPKNARNNANNNANANPNNNSGQFANNNANSYYAGNDSSFPPSDNGNYGAHNYNNQNPFNNGGQPPYGNNNGGFPIY